MRKFDQLKTLPVYQKAEEIAKLINGLLETIPEDDKILNDTKLTSSVSTAFVVSFAFMVFRF